jgi:hypothetical protein
MADPTPTVAKRRKREGTGLISYFSKKRAAQSADWPTFCSLCLSQISVFHWNFNEILQLQDHLHQLPTGGTGKGFQRSSLPGRVRS